MNEETLILYYYGEPDAAPECERHLDECPDCRRVYAELVRTLNLVDAAPVPDRGAEYGARVWARIEGRISGRARRWRWAPAWRWAAAGAALTGLLAAAFVAGRFYPAPGPAAPVATADSQLREGVLLVAVGDYLERSQMVLVELANANPRGPLDITLEQERAGDLVSEGRLYRQTASRTGDANVAGVLEELERVLVEITHEPSEIQPAALERFRERLRSEGILFKVRVLGATVRGEEAPAEHGTGNIL